MDRRAARHIIGKVAVFAALAAGFTVAPRIALAEVPVATSDDVPVVVAPTPSGPATASSASPQGAVLQGLEPFTMLALSWQGPADQPPAVQVGTGGSWRSIEVDAEDLTPDAGTPDGAAPHAAGRHATEPVWVGSADAVSITAPAGVIDVHLHPIRIRTHTELQPVGPQPAGAHSAGPAPFVHPRSDWGAAPPTSAPVYASAVRFAVVHHTVGSNDYSAADVPGIILGIQAYHQQTNGWSDIGYNFLVDRFGGIWEGHAGGIDKAVIGAHAGGFNTGSTGISLLGNFQTGYPSAEALDSLTTLIGWKLALAGADPLGSTTVTVGTTDTQTQYPQGSTQQIPTIVGHRDLDVTACPGANLYVQLPAIRSTTASKYPNVFGRLDRVDRAPGGAVVNGWAIDRSTTAPIQVHAYVDGTFAGYSVASNVRSDIGAAYPQAGAAHGYSFAVPASGPGDHTVCIYGINDSGPVNYLIGCATFTITVDPFGNLDALIAAPGGVQAQVWALDPDTANADEVDVLVDGRLAAYASAGSWRTDVAAIFPAYGPGRGTNINVPLSTGTHSVCVYAINVGPGSNTPLGCRTASYQPSPIGNVDAIVSWGATAVQAQLWAFDPDTAAPIEVHALIDGALAANATAGTYRGDIGAAFPGYGPYHSTNLNIPVPPGSHTLCIYAINVGTGVNTALTCTGVGR